MSMMRVEEAEALILEQVQPLDAECDRELVSLGAVLQRILAAPVTSELDFPHWDNSAMDGYAVRYEDVANASADQPTVLDVIEDIPAGKTPVRPVSAGQASRIFTGSMMPEGADTIVIQEETERDGAQVKILAAPESQAFVRHQGSFYKAGEPLLPAGSYVQAPEIAVLAAAQCIEIPVYRRPRVAILSTGDELMPINQKLRPGEIVDSNQYALAALVAQAGAIPLTMGIVPDDRDVLKDAIAKAASQADIVLSSGGVSVGDYDYVDDILAELDATLHIRSVAVKPGKPLTFATLPKTDPDTEAQSQAFYFGLPGNPVSALVSFWRFVQPAIRKRSGLPAPWSPKFVQARSQQTLKAGGKRETYLWGQLSLTADGYEFALSGGSHSSGNLINLANTSGLAVVPMGETVIEAGSMVRVMMVG
ncbi:MAG: molybdopterin molybdotransferase MoeA [Thainema sp.]